MIALGGGPTFTGWLIDVFKQTNGDLTAMRYAITVTCCVFILSVLCFLVVARVLPKRLAGCRTAQSAIHTKLTM